MNSQIKWISLFISDNFVLPIFLITDTVDVLTIYMKICVLNRLLHIDFNQREQILFPKHWCIIAIIQEKRNNQF